MSLTLVSKDLPSDPPGCDLAKSCSVKPFARSSAMARASPNARVAVVLEVGAKPRGMPPSISDNVA